MARGKPGLQAAPRAPSSERDRPWHRGAAMPLRISDFGTGPSASRRRPPCLPSGPRWRTTIGRAAARNSGPRRASTHRRDYRFLDNRHRRRRHRGDLLAQLHRLGHQLVRRDDAGDQSARSASAASIIRPVRTSPSPWPCRSPGQPLGAAGAGDDAQVDLGLAEFGVSPARMMSQIIASSQPPPSAKPATAAITGFCTCDTASHRLPMKSPDRRPR